jgi:hypothetical protein
MTAYVTKAKTLTQWAMTAFEVEWKELLIQLMQRFDGTQKILQRVNDLAMENLGQPERIYRLPEV